MFEGHRCLREAFCADPPTTGFVMQQLSWLNGNLSVSQTVHMNHEPGRVAEIGLQDKTPIFLFFFKKVISWQQ